MYSIREKEAVCTTKLQSLPASSYISDFQKLLLGLVFFSVSFFPEGEQDLSLVV